MNKEIDRLKEEIKNYEKKVSEDDVKGQEEISNLYSNLALKIIINDKDMNDESIKYLKQSYEWCKRAAENGLMEAQINTAFHNLNGIIIEKNIERARMWFLKAEKQSSIIAKIELAKIALHVEENKENKEKAIEVLKKYKDIESDAFFTLGLAYYYGNGVKQNRIKAVKMFIKLKEKNNLLAELMLKEILDN